MGNKIVKEIRIYQIDACSLLKIRIIETVEPEKGL